MLAATVVGFVTVGLNYLAPESAFLLLVNTSGAIALFVWLVICLSQLVLRRRMGAGEQSRLPVRMWGFPYLTWAVVAAIAAMLVGMFVLESTRESAWASVGLAAAVVALGAWQQRRHSRGEVVGQAAEPAAEAIPVPGR